MRRKEEGSQHRQKERRKQKMVSYATRMLLAIKVGKGRRGKGVYLRSDYKKRESKTREREE